jgi:hypothetical protein
MRLFRSSYLPSDGRRDIERSSASSALRRLVPASLLAMAGALALTATPALAVETEAAPPAIEETYVTHLGSTSATLEGQVNPGGGETTYRFEYGPSASYGQSTPVASIGAGNGGRPAVAQIQGLAPSTTYHYRLVASNAAGPSIGTDHTFTTLPPPVVSTGGAEGVGTNSVTISGTLETQGLQTQYEFDLGADTSYGSRIFGNAGVELGAQTFTVSVEGLQPSTTYHYRIVATNIFGTVYGADRTFTTAAVPSAALTAPAAPVLVPAPAAVAPTITSSAKPKPKPKPKAKKKKKHGKAKKSSQGKGRK